MAQKKNTYLKYDKNGRIIPTAVAVNYRQPKGHFKQMLNPNPDKCCENTGPCVEAKDYTTSDIGYRPFTTGGTQVVDPISYMGFSANNVPLGFNFNFYGQTYSHVSIGSNGVIEFADTNSYNFQNPLILPTVFVDAPALFPFTTQLTYNPAYESFPGEFGIFYQTLTIDGETFFSARFKTYLYGDTLDVPVEFEVRLYKDTNNIDVIYGSNIPDTSSPSVAGYLPIVGVQGFSDIYATWNIPFVNFMDYTNSAALSDRVIRFAPKCTAQAPLDFTCICYNVEVDNIGAPFTSTLSFYCGLGVFSEYETNPESTSISLCSYADPRIAPRNVYGQATITPNAETCESCGPVEARCHIVTKDSPNNEESITIFFNSAATGLPSSVTTSRSQTYICAIFGTVTISGGGTVTDSYPIAICSGCPATNTIKKCYDVVDATYDSSGNFSFYATHDVTGATWELVTLTGTPSGPVTLPTERMCSYLLPYVIAGSATITELPVQAPEGCTCTNTFFCTGCDYSYWRTVGLQTSTSWSNCRRLYDATKLASNRVVAYGRMECGGGFILCAYQWNGTSWNQQGVQGEYSAVGGNFYTGLQYGNVTYISDNKVMINGFNNNNSKTGIIIADFDGTNWTFSNASDITGLGASEFLEGTIAISDIKAIGLITDNIAQQSKLAVIDWSGSAWAVTSSSVIAPLRGKMSKISNTSVAILGFGNTYVGPWDWMGNWAVYNLVGGTSFVAGNETYIGPAAVARNLSNTEVVTTYDPISAWQTPKIRTYDKTLTGLSYVPVSTPLTNFLPSASVITYLSVLSPTEVVSIAQNPNDYSIRVQQYEWIS